jgi:hypothetical protein
VATRRKERLTAKRAPVIRALRNKVEPELARTKRKFSLLAQLGATPEEEDLILAMTLHETQPMAGRQPEPLDDGRTDTSRRVERQTDYV